jgi:hypothetical protein
MAHDGNVNFASGPTPTSATTAARLTDRDVIIARTGPAQLGAQGQHPESHNFIATLVIPAPTRG